MTRDFMEERRRQLIEDELNRMMERVFPSNTELGRKIRAIYSQNPLLNLLLNAKHPGSKSPYTQKINVASSDAPSADPDDSSQLD